MHFALRYKRRVTAKLIAVSLATSALAAVGASSATTTEATVRTVAMESSSQADPAATSAILHRVGLTPITMATAGLTTSEASQVIDAMMIHLLGLEDGRLLNETTARLNQAMRRAESTDSGQGLPNPVPAAPTPSETLSVPALRAEVQSMLDAAFDLATSGLSAAKKETLANVRANARWQLPTPYLAVRSSSRSTSEWISLRDALARRRYSIERGLSLDAQASGRLATADADPTVAAARADLQLLLSPIQEVWSDRLSPY